MLSLLQGDQISSLYSLLTFADKPVVSSPMTHSHERKAFRSINDFLRQLNEDGVLLTRTEQRRTEGIARS